jgi:hypothetical protein
VRASATERLPAWLDFAKERSWDLLLSYFDGSPGELPAAEMITAGGTAKFPALWETNHAHDNFLLNYRASLFLESDLDLRFADLDRLFAIFCEFDLALAQPSLTPQSYSSWPITLRSPAFRLRFTNFVEIMAPMFSAQALARCLPTFSRSISGWGLDVIWPFVLGQPTQAIAIIDEIAITHTRPVDLKDGRFYEYLRKLGVDPYEELRLLKEAYGVGSDYEPREFGGVPASAT